MKLLPIVSRELRVSSRRKSAYLNRVSAAAIAIVLAALMLFTMGGRSSAMMAQMLFSFLCGFAFLFAILSGLQFSSDSITEEKREGTLGLLFLTDLSAFEIVTGKLAVHSLNAFFSMVAILPILALPLLMGGVSPVTFRDMSLLLLNTMFFSLCAGMLGSCLSSNARGASTLTFLFVLVVLLGLPAFGSLCRVWDPIKPFRSEYWNIASPGFAWITKVAPNFPGPPHWFWQSLVINHCMAWALLLLSAMILPGQWRDKPATAKGMKFRERWKHWCYGGTSTRKAYRRALLDINSVYWLCARDRLKSATVWFVLGLIAVAWLYMGMKWNQEWFNPEVYLTTAILLHLLIKIWASSECGRQFAVDKQSGAMELLMSTPLEAQDFHKGQFHALLKQFGYPLYAILALDSLFFALGVDSGQGRSDDGWIWVFVIGVATLIGDLYGIYWLGLWRSVNVKNPNRLSGEVVACILILPGVCFAVLMILLASSIFRVNVNNEFVYSAWLIISLSNALFFAESSKALFKRHFRELASQPNESITTGGLIGRWLGGFYARKKGR